MAREPRGGRVPALEEEVVEDGLEALLDLPVDVERRLGLRRLSEISLWMAFISAAVAGPSRAAGGGRGGVALAEVRGESHRLVHPLQHSAVGASGTTR